MRILITGANSNVGRGLIPRLVAAGHELVLSDLSRLPETAPFLGHRSVTCDVQHGFGLEGAAAGCGAIIHLPAWHGIHSHLKSEADFWRLNVDGTFWMFQAAVAAGVRRVVFLSSMAWYEEFGKYGMTKRIGEDLCEYHRRAHGIAHAIIRPSDFTPWSSFLRYGIRLLHGGVDREDVLDAIVIGLAALEPAPGAGAAGHLVEAVRHDPFTEDQLAGWERDPQAAAEALFPGHGDLIRRYGLDLASRPQPSRGGNPALGWQPRRHFGTFLDELERLDRELGRDGVLALRCPYG